MNKTKKFWLTIVNIITFSRIIGSIVLFPVFFVYGQKTSGIMLLILFLTDSIDGFLARKYKVSTFFGSILDSVSDKLMSICAFTILCFVNKYLVIAIIFEILIILVNTFVLTQKGNIKSSDIGKIKTWVISVCIVLGFFFCKENDLFVNLTISIPCILFELLTFIDYFKKIFKLKVNITNEKPEYKSVAEINKMLFDPEFYEANKDKTGLIDNIYKK